MPLADQARWHGIASGAGVLRVQNGNVYVFEPGGEGRSRSCEAGLGPLNHGLPVGLGHFSVSPARHFGTSKQSRRMNAHAGALLRETFVVIQLADPGLAREDATSGHIRFFNPAGDLIAVVRYL